ncbi:hypothetical protein YC2023_037659 [Brassica napus]
MGSRLITHISSPSNPKEKNFSFCSADAPAVGASHRRWERSRIIIGFNSTVLILEKVILFVSGFRSGLKRGIDGLVSVLVCFGSVGDSLGGGLVGFSAVVVRWSSRVGLSGAICQVEDLLTVWHSCWGIAGAFADVFYGLSSTLAPLSLTVASEISILGWVVVSTGYMHGHVQVLLFRVWILSSIVEFSGSAFKVMAFSTWFWVCLEMFVALAFFFNGEASRGVFPRSAVNFSGWTFFVSRVGCLAVLMLLIYPDWRHVLVSFGCPFEISGSLKSLIVQGERRCVICLAELNNNSRQKKELNNNIYSYIGSSFY